jgi:tight adherence protein B
VSGGLTPVLLAALAGGMLLAAGREAALAAPAVVRWFRVAVDPLRRAGSEGYAPSAGEHRKLAVVGAGALALAGAFVAGPVPAPALAVAGPASVTLIIARRRARYRQAVERGVPQVALAIADALGAGRSTRAAVASSVEAVEGLAAVEMSRVRADLEVGMSLERALAGMRSRLASPRVDSIAAALVAPGLAAGDLAGLLRRFADAAAERDRIAAEARSATAQARFTGLLVVAMPSGAALFAELAEPGFVPGLLANPAAATILALAGVLQLGGFVSIRRLARIEDA